MTMATNNTRFKNVAALATHALHNWRAGAAARSPSRPMLAALALGLFAGAAIGLLGQLAATALAALGIALIAAVAAVNSSGRYRDWCLIAAFLSLFIIPLIHKSVGGYFWGLWQVLLFLVALVGLFPFLKFAVGNADFRRALVLFGVFLLLATVSSLYGRSQRAAFLYQLLSDLKPILVMALGFAALWQARTEELFWFAARWCWLPLLVLIGLEWGVPDAYFTFFPGRPIDADVFGIFPSRAMSAFEHPSLLATTAALLAIACLARSRHHATTSRVYQVSALIYFALVIFAVQRQEFLACVLASTLALALMRPQRIGQLLLIAALLVPGFLAVFTTLYWDSIVTEAAAWGIGNSGPIEHPRAQILATSINLARENFPLGSGLGTFGGAGAEKFDQSLYIDLGFGRYWWFGSQDYLMDMYWPNAIGETGLFGALLLALSYLAFLIAGIRCALAAGGRARLYWSMFAAGVFYILLLSMSSPSFQDPRLTLLAAVWAGIAMRCARLDAPAITATATTTAAPTPNHGCPTR